MDLHELHTGAEWYDVSDQKRTPVQRLAARTLGVVTPGNFITILGALITISGLVAFWQSSFVVGLILIGLGRLFDILDGYTARRTHTSSPVGEGLDAATDKFVILLAAGVLLLTHAVPTVLMTAVAILELVTAVTVMTGRKLGVRLHPLRIGKYATFGLWSALLLYLVAHSLGATYGTGRILYILATVGGAISFGGAFVAFVRYVRTILQHRANAVRDHKRFF